MSRSKRFGIVGLVFALFLWALAGIIVKLLAQRGIDQDIQNLYRYASATLGLWVLIAVIFGRRALAALTHWKYLLLPVIFNFLYQVARVHGLYQPSIFPGFVSLLLMSSVICSVVLAFILFRDERKNILSRRYLAGTGMAIVGVAGVILMGEWGKPDFNFGVLVLMIASLFWSGYTLSMKSAVRRINPILAFTAVATLTTLFFAVLATVRSHPEQFLEINRFDQALIVLSGLLGIGTAHSLYFYAVKQLGVAICATALLLLPVFTLLVSWAILGECLLPGQFVMGIVLLAGVYLCSYGRNTEKAEQTDKVSG